MQISLALSALRILKQFLDPIQSEFLAVALPFDDSAGNQKEICARFAGRP